MKIPEYVYVMGHKYDIIPMNSRDFVDNDSYGDFSSNKRQIRVYTEVHMSIIRDTILHEILHACWYMLSLSKTEDEERAVNGISTLLIGVIDDPRNKETMEFILSNEETTNTR